MGKVNNKRKISRGGGKFNSVVVNALQPMQNTGVISVMQSNATNLNNSVVSTTALTSVAHPQTNSSSNQLTSLNQSSSLNLQNQSIMSLTSQQASLANLAPNQAPNGTNQLMPGQLSNQLQACARQPNNGSATVRGALNSLQASSNHPLLDLQAMNSLTNCNPSDLSSQSALAMLGGGGQPFSNLSNVNNVNLNSNLSASLGSNMNGNLVNNMTDSIQPQHNSKCARFDTGSSHELKWDLKLKPSNLIKIENDLNNPSPNGNSSNNHSHDSSSSLQEQANCLLKTNCDLNVKLTGGYSHKSRNGKYELKILKQPEEQHRWVSISTLF